MAIHYVKSGAAMRNGMALEYVQRDGMALEFVQGTDARAVPCCRDAVRQGAEDCIPKPYLNNNSLSFGLAAARTRTAATARLGA
jgi:FixJ family two-component response regulator